MKRLAVQTVIGLVLFVVIDVLILLFGLAGARERADAANRSFRIRNDMFHHSLAPNFSGHGQWGRKVYPVFTNDLGLLDAQVRRVARIPDKPRLLIMGDSFGEGLGFGWADTFAGQLARARPDVEVLNGSVSSYSPSIHRRKVQWLLDQGYKVDHVLVALDISDVQDEAYYVADGDNVSVRPAAPGTQAAGERGVVARAVLNLPLTSVAYYLARAGLSRVGGYGDVFDRCRGAWTYDWGSTATDAHYRDITEGQEQHLATCAKGAGAPMQKGSPSNIQRAIDRAEARMTELHGLLQARGIAMSVMVYPWPGQLVHDDRDSRQVRIWRDWCAARCAQFIDTFPDFFAHKTAQPQTWYCDLYVAGDVHFNERGNAVLSARLASAFQGFAR